MRTDKVYNIDFINEIVFIKDNKTDKFYGFLKTMTGIIVKGDSREEVVSKLYNGVELFKKSGKVKINEILNFKRVTEEEIEKHRIPVYEPYIP